MLVCYDTVLKVNSVMLVKTIFHTFGFLGAHLWVSFPWTPVVGLELYGHVKGQVCPCTPTLSSSGKNKTKKMSNVFGTWSARA